MKRTTGAVMERDKNVDLKLNDNKSVSTGKVKDIDDVPTGSEEEFNLYDVDGDLKKLKVLPAVLHMEDFVNTFALGSTGQTTHRPKKGEVFEEVGAEYFGKDYGKGGKGGRAGYKWQDCTNKAVLVRVKHLHPIVYQHDRDNMPSLLRIKFAHGIAFEHVNGRRKVNWAVYKQETNHTQ